jgi:kelch-like protein 1/4/5
MEVVGNQEFVQLGADQVAKLLASEDLNVPSEEYIFNVSGNFLAFIYHVQLNNENSKVPFRME